MRTHLAGSSHVIHSTSSSVLLVEDNEDIREGLGILLESEEGLTWPQWRHVQQYSLQFLRPKRIRPDVRP